MEEITERISQIIDSLYDGNNSAFANAIGWTPANLSNYVGKSKTNKPSVKLLVSIVKSLKIDANWLLTGEKQKQEPDSVSVNGSHNQVNGDGAQGNINGAGIDVAVLEERIKAMQQLLDEKERTIKILMGK